MTRRWRPWDRLRLGLGLGAVLLLAAPVQADEAPRLAAVGYVSEGPGGGCTGTLIAPDLVLTAAHCLDSKHEDASLRATALSFRPSLASGAAGPAYPGRAIALHPEWEKRIASGAGTFAIIAVDLGLLRLAAPVPETLARPLPVAGRIPALEAPPTLASFHAPGTEPLRVRPCPALLQGLSYLVLGCSVVRGESGAPVLLTEAGQPRLVALVTNQSSEQGRPIAIGPLLGWAFEQLLPLAPP